LFVPSQVREYIDSTFAEAKRQVETGQAGQFYLERHYAPQVRLILRMVDEMPSHLVTLRGNDLAEFYEAVEALRQACVSWESDNYKLAGLKTRGNLHPIALIRKHVAALHDEGIAPGVSGLPFIVDQDVREQLRRDITAVEAALRNQEWKAATVLGGSVVEALLLDAALTLDGSDPGKPQAIAKQLHEQGKIARPPNRDLNEWRLHELTEVILAAQLIADVTAQQCRIAREFRNLIHPGKERIRQPCDKGTALSAAAAIEHVIRDRT
jgi:hypothetical protein